MALICDTGGIYAIHDASDNHHHAVKAVVQKEKGPLLLPVILLAEIDFLLTRRLGVAASLDFLESVRQGAFTLVTFSDQDLARCYEIIEKYHDLDIGIADASVVATAERLSIQRLLTVDERHFRVLKPRNFPNFILLPADQA